MLTENLRKCELSIAYLHTIATKCGFEFAEPRIDNDSVDVLVSANGLMSEASTLHTPKIDIQLKATINWDRDTNEIYFPLKKKNYDDLRARCVVPKILLVLCLPPLEEEWISHSTDNLILRKCAYWVSLKDLPETTNETSVTVSVPELFTPEALTEILLKISKEEW